MMRTHRIALFAFLLLAIISLLYFTRSREPHFKGRSLSSWLKQLDDGDAERGISWAVWAPKQTPEQKQAAEAIRQIGTNSLPFLIQYIADRESGLKSFLLDILRKKQSLIKIPDQINRHPRQAALAFDALGPIARPAVPELSRLMTESEVCKEVSIALAAIGPDGWAVLQNKLTDTNITASSWTKSCAIWGLASHHVTQPGTVDYLIGEVTSTNSSQAIAGWALGELGTNQDQAIPALIKGLQSPGLGTRWGAFDGLGRFGTNATSAVPVLVQSLQDPDGTIRDYARRALKLIDPEALKKAEKE